VGMSFQTIQQACGMAESKSRGRGEWQGGAVVIVNRFGSYTVIPAAWMNDSRYVGSREVVARYVRGKNTQEVER
jgi:hypothetical protein